MEQPTYFNSRDFLNWVSATIYPRFIDLLGLFFMCERGFFKKCTEENESCHEDTLFVGSEKINFSFEIERSNPYHEICTNDTYNENILNKDKEKDTDEYKENNTEDNENKVNGNENNLILAENDDHKILKLITIGNANSNSDRPEKPRVSGIQNLGKSCYINSVLQCLFSSRKFINFISRDQHGESALKILFLTIYTEYEKSVSFINPEKSINQILHLLKPLNIADCKTEGDSCEFYRIIANALHREHIPGFLLNSIIRNYIICNKCATYKHTGDEESPSIILHKTCNCLSASLTNEYLLPGPEERQYERLKNFTCTHQKEIFYKLVDVNDVLVFEISLNNENMYFAFKTNISVLGKRYGLVGFIKYIDKSNHYVAIVKHNQKWFLVNDNKVVELEHKYDGFRNNNTVLVFYEVD